MNEMLEKLGQNAKDAETVLRNLSTNTKPLKLQQQLLWSTQKKF